MNIEKLIEEIYRHISLPKPKEILEYNSLADAFSDFEHWSKRVEKVMPCFWSYQFPMAIPGSYWGSCHLKKDGYRLDVKRKPNDHGCFVYGEYIKEQPNQSLTQETYEKLCDELSRQTFDNNDELIDEIFELYESEIDLFADLMIREDPTCQMTVSDFIFLGNFKWVQEELWFLSRCRDSYNIPVNEPMLDTLEKIHRSKKFFITFTNIVVVIG